MILAGEGVHDPGKPPIAFARSYRSSQMRAKGGPAYQAALDATLAPDVKRSTDAPLVTASESQGAGGIRLGIQAPNGRCGQHQQCDALAARMNQLRRRFAGTSGRCGARKKTRVPRTPPRSIFFDWDVEVPTANEQRTVDEWSQPGLCGWRRFDVVGQPIDRGGHLQYRQFRRAARTKSQRCFSWLVRCRILAITGAAKRS